MPLDPTWGVGRLLLGETRWGALWLARQGILLAITAVTVSLVRALGRPGRGRRPSGQSTATLAGLCFALMLVQALSGHAADLTRQRELAVLAATLHLLAAGLWVGGLLALGVALLPAMYADRAGLAVLARAGWAPFSRLAALSLGVLVVTGLYNSGRQVASLDALISTSYGWALLAKLGLGLGAGAFGLLTAVLLHQRIRARLARLLDRPPGWAPLPLPRLRPLVLAEASLGLLALLAAGTLASSPVARGLQFAPPAEAVPTYLSQSVGDLRVALEAKPNRPGPNVLAIRAASTRRPAPAEITGVVVHFTPAEADLSPISTSAEPVEPGLYRLGGSQLSRTGPWQIDVAVQRAGLPDAVARFDWTVGSAGPARPVILSNRAWEPLLTGAAAVLILAAGAVSAAVWLVHQPLPGSWGWAARRRLPTQRAPAGEPIPGAE